jgi:hypothetical protein
MSLTAIERAMAATRPGGLVLAEWSAVFGDAPSVLNVAPRSPLARATVSLDQLPLGVNITLMSGDDFTLAVDVADPDSGDPADLSGAVAIAQIRAAPLEQPLPPPGPPPLGEWYVQVEASTVWLHLQSATSWALPRASVWDCKLDWDGRHSTLAGGNITLMPSVSRW